MGKSVSSCDSADLVERTGSTCSTGEKSGSMGTSSSCATISRASLVVYLLAGAAILGSLSYLFAKPDDNFAADWSFSAQEIVQNAQRKAERSFDSVASIANLYPMLVHQSGASLPYVTLKDFESFGKSARESEGFTSIAYAPYLKDESMREEWEQYSTDESGWIQHALSFYPELQGTQQNFSGAIWMYNSDGERVTSPGNSAPYLPSWQLSPPPVVASSIVNFDYASMSLISKSLQWAVQSKKPLLTEAVDVAELYGVNSGAVPSDSPASLMLQPVFTSLDNAASSLAGVVVAAIPWTTFFEGILEEGQKGIMIVAENCGVNSTFFLNGPQAYYLGAGDLHEASFDKSAYKGQLLNSGGDSTGEYCECNLYVYPSNFMESTSSNSNAVALCASVVVVFVVAAVLFLLYDRYLRRSLRSPGSRSKSMEVEALLNHAVMEVHRRSLDLDVATAEAAKNLDGDDDPLKDGQQDRVEKQITAEPVIAPSMETKEALMKYVSTSAKPETGSKPIAELFPEATVLFADISGFTAWSSIREPSQVFTLLESIFGAFDAIAQERGVFKVETVGDCYVAVCGLPEANKDHAIVMARFARECMEKVNEIIRELELTLGPDTAELAMRFGIHSGPITAGVLRGDRARFQLFGDTVNTAARIETTGKRNRIHLSEQTASLIMATGRKNWVIEREDPVEAKGKGVMKTYWLLTLASERGGDGSGANAESGNGEEYVPKSSFMERIKAIKESRASKERRIQRLIQWNSEMLVQLLKQVVARREALQRRTTASGALTSMARNIGNGCIVVDEVAEIIMLPEFDVQASSSSAKDVQLDEKVVSQIHSYVSVIASMYKDNPFHNFEHASHVTMSVSKLLSRIVAPQIDKSHMSNDEAQLQATLHDHTYGITSDPLTQFAVVLTGLIHDVDHRGVPNFVLVNEEKTLASVYRGKSVAEQNSLDLCWAALMKDEFAELRACIFGDISELKRFRQLLVNSVIATDIFDKELAAARKARWEKAFDESFNEEHRKGINRKATIVIEHLIQASDVAHTMQHWHVYTKWNEKLYQEMYEAYRSGRSETDPTINWYQGEIGFLDNYVIPLAKKLKNCGVFGVASDEYLNYAQENRREWAARGKEIVAGYVEKHAKKDLAAKETATGE